MPRLIKSNFAQDTFSIISNGFEYKDCWESIDITMSMENVCNEITVSTLNFFEDKLSIFKASDDWKLKKGSKYIAKINDQIISTGYVDKIGVGYSADGSFIEFYMRDKTSDLVDCPYFSEKISEFKNNTLLAIIENLCIPFGITVIVDPTVQELLSIVIPNYTIDQGRSVAELIVEECVKVGVLVITDGNGNLYLTQPTTQDICGDIITDTNIINADMGSSMTDRFSNYITKAEIKSDKLYNISEEQTWIEREKEGAYSSTKRNIQDLELGDRFRPLILLSDTAQTIEDCVKRSVYEANIRKAKSLIINYVVEGWTEISTGLVRKPNKLVRVKDRMLGVEELMLVNGVNLNYNESGFQTTLELVRKECYSLNEQALQLIRKGF